MTTERYTSVINIEYLGTRDVDRYLSDLRRLGAVSDKVYSQLRGALSGGLGGVESGELRRALAVGSAGIRDYDKAAEKVTSSLKNQAAATATLRREIEALQATIGRVQSPDTFKLPAGGEFRGRNPGLRITDDQLVREVRKVLYNVLQASAINQRAAGSIAAAQVLQPNQPRAIESASSSFAREMATQQARFENRLIAALNARSNRWGPTSTMLAGVQRNAAGEIMGGQFQTSVTDRVRSDARYAQERIRDLEQELATTRRATRVSTIRNEIALLAPALETYQRVDPFAYGPVPLKGARQPLALSAGSGLDPGLSAIQRFNQRIERIIDARPTQIPNLSFSQDGTGRMSIDGFTQEIKDTTKSASLLDQRIQTLARALQDEEAAARRSTKLRREAAEIAETTNRATLEARIAQARAMPGQSATGIPEEPPPGNRMFWQDGIANREVLGQYRLPEERAFLVGEFGGDPLQEYARLLSRKTQGVTVPDFVSRDSVMEDLVAERTADTRRQLEAAEARRNQIGPFAQPRAFGAEERLARAQEALADAVRIRTIAERLAAAQAEAAALPRALPPGTGRGPLMIEAGNYGSRVPALDVYDITTLPPRSGAGGGQLPPGGGGGTRTGFGGAFDDGDRPNGRRGPDIFDIVENNLNTFSSTDPLEEDIKRLRGVYSRRIAELGQVKRAIEAGDFDDDPNAGVAALTKARENQIAANRALRAAEDKLEKATDDLARQRRANLRVGSTGTAGLGTAGPGGIGAGPGGPGALPGGPGGPGQLPPGGGAGIPGGPDDPNDLIRRLEALLNQAFDDSPEAKVKAARASAEAARINAEQVRDRVISGDFDDDEAASKAYLTARAREINAANRLARAEQELEEETKRAAARLREASVAASGPSTGLPGVSGFGGRGDGVFQPTGFVGDFKRGFIGERYSAPYGEQLGQTFKFSLMYGAAYQILTGITATFAATLQEGIEFQQSVTDLKLATGRADASMDELADALGQSSVAYGQAPSQGVLIGARSVGLYGASTADAATQARIANLSADVVNRLALTSGMAPADLQTNIAAITNAFGGGFEAQALVGDFDQYFSQRFGVAPGGTIQAVAEAGSVGSAAGFSQPEVNAIAALLQGRTGQTASTVAGYMAQIFSRGGEGSLTAVAERFGVDTASQDLAGQIEDLAAVYRDANGNERNEIAAAFGRGKVQNAVTVLLEGLPEVQDAARDALTEAPGSAEAAAQLRLSDIGGQLQQTLGVLKEFANQLGQTGILDILGAGAVALRELVEATTGVLRLWNELDGPMKAAIAGLVALGLAARSTAVRTAVGNAVGNGIIGAAARGGSRAGVVGNAAAAGLGAIGVNPVTIAIGGLLALGQLKSTSDKLAAAQTQAADLLANSELGADATPDELRGRASALSTVAAEQRASVDSRLERFQAGILGQLGDTTASAGALEGEAARLNSLAELLERRQAGADPLQGAAAIAGFDADTVKTGLDAITQAGGTADERFRALADALNGTATAAQDVRNSFDVGEFSLRGADPLIQAITGNISYVDVREEDAPLFSADRAFGQKRIVDRTDETFRDLFDPASATRALRKNLEGVDVAGLDEASAALVAEGIVADSPLEEMGGTLADLESAKRGVVAFLLTEKDRLAALMEGARGLTGAETTSYVDLLVQEAEGRLAGLQTTDFAGRLSAAKGLVRQIESAISRGQRTPAASQDLADARRRVAEIEIERLETLRKVAQQNATSAAEVANIGRSFLTREIGAAVGGGAQDKLVELIGLAGAYGKDIALKAVEDLNRVVKVALRAQALALAAVGPMLGPIGAALEFLGSSNADLTGLEQAIEQAVSGDPDSDPFATGSDVPGLGAIAGAQATAAEIAAAKAAAYATKSESPIRAAKAAVQSAKASLAKTEVGTLEYWQALDGLFAAQNSLTDAILEHQRVKFLLARDITDPIVQAQADLIAAQQKYRSDLKSGAGQDVLDQDRLDIRTAQAALESTKFQQNLSAMQTADQLGQITHQAYIRYLDRQRERLEGIKNRTYQEQQQLNEVTSLLQDAQKTLQGQFNLGDIKLPTPYQVRRYIEATSGGAAATAAAAGAKAAPTSVSTTTINIDGADTGKVTRIINDVLGKPGRTRTSTSRRR